MIQPLPFPQSNSHHRRAHSDCQGTLLLLGLVWKLDMKSIFIQGIENLFFRRFDPKSLVEQVWADSCFSIVHILTSRSPIVMSRSLYVNCATLSQSISTCMSRCKPKVWRLPNVLILREDSSRPNKKLGLQLYPKERTAIISFGGVSSWVQPS